MTSTVDMFRGVVPDRAFLRFIDNYFISNEKR